MVLGGMIKYNAGDITHGAGLASGVNIENLDLAKKHVRHFIKIGAKMPLKVSAQSVINASNKVAEMEENVQRAKQFSDARLSQVSAALDYLTVAESHAEGMMKHEQRYQQIGAKFAQAQRMHRLSTGIIQAEDLGRHNANVRNSVFDSL